MKKRSYSIAAGVLPVVLALGVLFHVLVISGLINFRFVWGGRLQSYREMVLFEIISLVVNALVLWLVLQRTGKVKRRAPHGLLTAVLWLLAALFALNTLGNLMAESLAEKLAATPVTAFLSWCCAVLAVRGPGGRRR